MSIDNLQLKAWAYLSRVADGPCAASQELAALVQRVGPVEAAELVQRGAVAETVAAYTQERRQNNCAAEDLDILARMGGRLITPGDEEWPALAFAAFDQIPAEGAEVVLPRAPLALWALGPTRLDEAAEGSAAIVGTRAATAYGEHIAADLAAGAAAAGVPVISSAAYGIDGAVQRAVLAADGTSVAVHAAGIDVAYPAGHSALLHRIGSRGLLVTEFAPGVRPTRPRFAARNRLIAALAGVTTVVESGVRSGALGTAGWARRLGRPVAAVPGPVTSAMSAGCHALIGDGAAVVSGRQDILRLLGQPVESRAG